MKALIIILALVGVSFVGLLIFGGSGEQVPSQGCERVIKVGDEYKVPDEWCPPSIAKATRPLQARFGPGLDLPKPGKVVKDINPQHDQDFTVPPIGDPKKRRTAKLTLVSGDWAIVEGPEKFTQCLCRPKQPVPVQLRDPVCGTNWHRDHAEQDWMCQSADKWGTIPIEWTGGQLTFKKGPTARVEVK